ncbi:MAG: Uma2 family endonuclease [Planctomycetota bacterium]
MTAPRLIPHYSVEDYQSWQGDWELWDGIPVSMSPSPFGPHSAAVVRIIASLVAQLEECHAQVLTELDWIVDSNTVIRPDVVVVCGDVPQHHIESPPALIVEVISESTRQRDTIHIPKLCREHGVEYALVDAINKASDRQRIALCDDCHADLSYSMLFP